MMQEPSILEYIKSLFDPETTIDIHNHLNIGLGEKVQPIEWSENNLTRGKGNGKIILGSGLALLAQVFLEPSCFHLALALFLYLLSVVFLWGGLAYQPILKKQKITQAENNFQFRKKDLFLILSILFQTASFFMFSENQFNLLNFLVWVMGIIFLVIAVCKPKAYSIGKPQKKDLGFFSLIALASIFIYFSEYFN